MTDAPERTEKTCRRIKDARTPSDERDTVVDSPNQSCDHSEMHHRANALPQHITPTAATSCLSCSARFWFEHVACIRKPTTPARLLGKAAPAVALTFPIALADIGWKPCLQAATAELASRHGTC